MKNNEFLKFSEICQNPMIDQKKIEKILLNKKAKTNERNEKQEKLHDQENEINKIKFGIDFKSWNTNLKNIENNIIKLKREVSSQRLQRNNEIIIINKHELKV